MAVNVAATLQDARPCVMVLCVNLIVRDQDVGLHLEAQHLNLSAMDRPAIQLVLELDAQVDVRVEQVLLLKAKLLFSFS